MTARQGFARFGRRLAIVLSVPAFVALAANHLSVVDDAYITMRYAQHWLETGQLTWHIGLPMVDGYTSLAHVWMLALGGWLGLDLVDVNSGLNLLAFVGILAVYGLACRQLGLVGWSCVAGLYVIVLNSGFAFWVTGGLDGVLWTLRIFVTYLECERCLAAGRFRLSLLVALLAIIVTRPEGTFVALAVAAYVLGYLLSHRRVSARQITLHVFVLVASILTLYGWRLETYGHLFPNAFYAKDAATRWIKVQTGLRYLMVWMAFYGGVLVFAVFAHIKRSFFENTRAYFIVGLVLIIILEGGDPQPQMRFFLPVVPLLALHVAALLQSSAMGMRALVGALGVFSIVVQFTGKEPWRNVYPLNEDTRVVDLLAPVRPLSMLTGGLANLWAGEWPLWHGNYEHWNAEASRHLAGLLRPDVMVASTDVGALAYFSRLQILDAQCLNDREIAHFRKPRGFANVWGVEHWERAVARGVDVIVPGFLQYVDLRLTDLRIGELSDAQWTRLFTRPLPGLFERVRETFTCVSVEDPRQHGRYLNLLVRREQLAHVWRTSPPGLSTADCR